MIKKILQHTQKLQTIPNVPFLVEPIRNYIKEIINKNNYSFVDNRYSLIVNAVKNPSKPKRIFMAHTDHPGIIIKNKYQGIAMGTLEVDRLKKILTQGAIKLRIFNPNGIFLGIGEMTDIDKNDRDITLKIPFDVLPNSFAQYDMQYYKTDRNNIFAYSLDDSISVAILLSLLQSKLESKYDIYFVFNLYEEVHQISAWNLAKNNFLKINKEDIFINLESQKVKNIDKSRYSTSNYSNGPILQLSNTGCLFGYNTKGSNNAESIIESTANKANMKLQLGLIMDSDDSRPFSYFPLTPNIATINIPNMFKHNCNENGEIVAEEVKKQDVVDVYELVKMIIESDTKQSNVKNVSETLKSNDEITNKTLMKQKALLNNRLELSYYSVVKRGYYYPLTIKDKIADMFCKIGFYGLYYIQKLSINTI